MRTRWTTRLAAPALAVALAVSGVPAADAQKATALDRFKALAGEWVAAADSPMVKKGQLVVRYSLTGAGTAVVEEIFPGSPHAMTTVYHLDGKDLVLTHYCMSGTQPRMRAKATEGPRVVFAYDGGTNIDVKTSQHMHEATFDFLGPDEIKSTWIEFEGGKPAMTVNMHLVRKTS